MSITSRNLTYFAYVVVACLLAGIPVRANSQARADTVARSKQSAALLQWNKGSAHGRIYANGSVGIEIIAPPELEFGQPELMGTAGRSLLATITALGGETLFSARKAMAFYTDALAYYPPTRRSTDAYVQRVVKANQQNGFEALAGSSESRIGELTFARQDFSKGQLSIVYQAVLVKACQAQALVFIFKGSDRKTVDDLIGSTKLKIDPEISGCGADRSKKAQP